MGHGLRQAANGQYAHAYVGEVGWHGLGQQLQPGAPIEEWAVAAHMDYQLERAVVEFTDDTGASYAFDGKHVIYRNDDKTPVGVVSEGFKIVQPIEVLEFFRDLCESNQMQLETAGVLKNGALYWALAKMNMSDTIGGDRFEGYTLLSTAADGSRSTDGRFTGTRVVCRNTIEIALARDAHGSRPKAVKTRHSSEWHPEATKRALGLVDYEASWAAFAADMKRLQQIDVTAEQSKKFFADLLRPPKQLVTVGRDESERAIRGMEDLQKSYTSAPGAAPGTAYGLLQGVTHFIDHVRGRDDDKRITSAWFGQGNAMKNRALDQLRLAD